MDTKESITYSAFVVFLEKGYKNATYNELVKAAGVSKGAFYHHFKNKEHLFFEVIDRYFLSFFEKVNWAELEDLTPDDLEKCVRSFYLKFTRQVLSITDKGMGRYFILFFEAMELYPHFRTTAREFYIRLRKSIDAAATRSGTDRNGIDIISRYEGYVFWLAMFHETDIDDFFSKS